MFHSPGSVPRITKSAAGGPISVSLYTSTQTITIPKGATKANIYLAGGGGYNATNFAGGSSGACFKFLTGLVGGLTLALTIGAGATTTAAGGNSTLASGSQRISTLTSNGGLGANSGINAGGTSSGGDLNLTGNPSGYDPNTSLGFRAAHTFFGDTYGAGGSSGISITAKNGACFIEWFA